MALVMLNATKRSTVWRRVGSLPSRANLISVDTYEVLQDKSKTAQKGHERQTNFRREKRIRKPTPPNKEERRG
jgi:hypothetical protein